MDGNSRKCSFSHCEEPSKKKILGNFSVTSHQEWLVQPAVNQLKQANKESSVEAQEEKTATVDTTEDGEVEEDKKQQQYKVWNQMR